ncbi:uncharacterized protein [Rutidosis leptorrhynchoides]|uniref:uncharacterized protein n=1 Tax=Rutidosis leptorrhynchoides TaxID=125765 RepID=UPI003A99E9E1
MELEIQRQTNRSVRAVLPIILWKNLNGDKGVTKEYLGETVGTFRRHNTSRESCWISEEVQAKVTVKQVRFKELITLRDGPLVDRLRAKERYKEAKIEAKKVVSHAKDKAYEELYKRLDSKEGANDIFKIAKARERRRRDLDNIKFIKDEAGQSIVKEDGIRKRWEEYFLSLYHCGWLTSLFNKTFRSQKMPTEWRCGEVISIYKNKGDAQVCSNYSGIKLLSHTMKLWERVIDTRLQHETKVSENQIWFHARVFFNGGDSYH